MLNSTSKAGTREPKAKGLSDFILARPSLETVHGQQTVL